MVKRLRFSLLGHPVAHSISPTICAAAFSALGLPHGYNALDVASKDELRRALDNIRLGIIAGANVTLPYKRTVLDMVDDRAESAAKVGAANVLTIDRDKRIIAHNTDAEALAGELAELWTGRPKFRAAIVGTGGAGLAAVAACQRLGFKVICVTSRSWTSSEEMFSSPSADQARALGALTTLWPKSQEARPSSKASQVLRLQWGELAIQADVIIQATSAGMLGGAPGEDVCDVVPWDQLPPHVLMYDVVYVPKVTPFVARAQARNIRVASGLGMLVRQAQLAIRLWTGEEAPLDVMRAAAEEALGAATKADSSSPPPKLKKEVE